jgi:hypothetical protein
MTTISETTGPRNRPHTGIWRRAAHALGKVWAKMIALPEAHSAAWPEVPPESWRFPPF